MRAGGGVWAGELRGELGTGTGRRISRVVSSAGLRLKATGPAGEVCCHGEEGEAAGAGVSCICSAPVGTHWSGRHRKGSGIV